MWATAGENERGREANFSPVHAWSVARTRIKRLLRIVTQKSNTQEVRAGMQLFWSPCRITLVYLCTRFLGFRKEVQRSQCTWTPGDFRYLFFFFKRAPLNSNSVEFSSFDFHLVGPSRAEVTHPMDSWYATGYGNEKVLNLVKSSQLGETQKATFWHTHFGNEQVLFWNTGGERGNRNHLPWRIQHAKADWRTRKSRRGPDGSGHRKQGALIVSVLEVVIRLVTGLPYPGLQVHSLLGKQRLPVPAIQSDDFLQDTSGFQQFHETQTCFGVLK